MRPVIYVRLMGGLGNQMFQYAAARRLALKHGTGVTLDVSHFDNPPQRGVGREYELDCFALEANVTHEPVVTARRGPLGITKKPLLIREKRFAFQPELLNAGDNVLLTGYWQSEKYFVDCSQTIRRDFTFRSPLSPISNP